MLIKCMIKNISECLHFLFQYFKFFDIIKYEDVIEMCI